LWNLPCLETARLLQLVEEVTSASLSDVLAGIDCTIEACNVEVVHGDIEGRWDGDSFVASLRDLNAAE